MIRENDFDIPDWILRHGDCMDPVNGMPGLPEKYADHVITDPPYTQRTSEGARTGDGSSGRFITFDGVDGLEPTIAQNCLRLAKRWTMIWCAFEQVGTYQATAGDRYVRAGVWHKPDPTPQFTGDRPAMCGEACAIFHAAGKKRWNGGGRPAFWSIPTCKGSERPDHPTPKPIDLMIAIIRDFTDPGDLICDPFAGSGTTGVAAIRLGRRFIGWERDPKYHAIAIKRLAAAREQMDIFSRTQKHKKPKQTKLFGGVDVKEESKEGSPVEDLEAEGSVSGDLLGSGSGQADADRSSETGDEGQPGRTLPVADYGQAEDSEETDHTEGPEDGGPEGDEAERGW